MTAPEPRDLDDEPKECQACGGGYNVQTYRRNSTFPRETSAELCGFCAGSMAGNADEYPEQYPERTVLIALSAQMNILLAALRGVKT